MNKLGKYGMFLHIVGLLILPLQILLLISRVITGKEKLERIFERLSIPSDDSKDDLIWIHCASVGETVSAFSLIDIILKKKKNSCFLLTTGTITSANLAISKMEQYNHFCEKQIVIHQMLPVDNLLIAKKFISYWRPKLGIFIESELWPSITYAAKINKIPLVIANGRMSGRSCSRWKRFSWIIKNMASCFDLVLAQSEIDSANFKKIGFKNVKLVGNLKYYLKDEHIDLELDSKISSEIGDRKVIFAASTHQGEEREIIKIYDKLLSKYKDLLLVIAPRHPSRLEEIESLILESNFKTSIRSKGSPITKKTNIYILDTIGELASIYRLKPITIMGGSFTVGGHNIIEPARYESLVIYGPDMSNFAEISSEFLQQNASIQAQSWEKLGEILSETLSLDKKSISHHTKAAFKIIKSKQDIPDIYLKSLEKYL